LYCNVRALKQFARLTQAAAVCRVDARRFGCAVERNSGT
jgi:hypothetical protein